MCVIFCLETGEDEWEDVSDMRSDSSDTTDSDEEHYQADDDMVTTLKL